MNVRTKHWTLKPHRNMRQHKVFLRHELLKYNSEKSTAKSSALENYISSANLSLSGCSSAEPNSVSVGRCKFQLKKLYLQTVKKVDHLPFQHYGFIVKLLEDISREQDVLFFLGIRFWRILSVLSCFPSRWGIISLTQKSIF